MFGRKQQKHIPIIDITPSYQANKEVILHGKNEGALALSSFDLSLLKTNASDYKTLFTGFVDHIAHAAQFNADIQEVKDLDFSGSGCDICVVLQEFEIERLKSCQNTFLQEAVYKLEDMKDALAFTEESFSPDFTAQSDHELAIGRASRYHPDDKYDMDNFFDKDDRYVNTSDNEPENYFSEHNGSTYEKGVVSSNDATLLVQIIKDQIDVVASTIDTIKGYMK